MIPKKRYHLLESEGCAIFRIFFANQQYRLGKNGAHNCTKPSTHQTDHLLKMVAGVKRMFRPPPGRSNNKLWWEISIKFGGRFSRSCKQDSCKGISNSNLYTFPPIMLGYPHIMSPKLKKIIPQNQCYSARPLHIQARVQILHKNPRLSLQRHCERHSFQTYT